MDKCAQMRQCELSNIDRVDAIPRGVYEDNLPVNAYGHMSHLTWLIHDFFFL